MTQHVRELLKDALGKHAFDALSMEERKRITGVMREMIAQAGLERIKEAVNQNKGKIQAGNFASKVQGQEKSNAVGSITLLMPLLAALQKPNQDKVALDARPGTPESTSPLRQDHDMNTPFPDPLAMGTPKPDWAR